MIKIPYNILRYIGIALDWVNKNLGRLKTTGLILVFFLFVISFVNNGCNRKDAVKLVERITGLDLRNDILSLHNRTLQDSLNKEKILRLKLEHSKALLLKEKETLAKDNKRLKKQLAGIPEWLLNMPADSSYKFLNEIAYPYPGEQRFRFNEPQVKNIHKDYLENVELTGLVAILENQLVNCEKIGDNADSLAVSFMNSFNVAQGQKVNLEKIVTNTEEKATLYKDALDKTYKGRNFWRTTTAIGSVIILILIL